jgi:hypothetical protein
MAEILGKDGVEADRFVRLLKYRSASGDFARRIRAETLCETGWKSTENHGV